MPAQSRPWWVGCGGLLGGWVVEEHSGGLAHTTNNVMEMTAVLEGLRRLPAGSRACVVTTNSRYLHA